MHVKFVLAGVVAALALSPTVAVHAQAPSSLPLVQAGDMRYLGSFAVPSTDGSSGQDGLLTYGGQALGMGANGKTLLIGCHDWEQRLAEVSIPAIGGTATIVKPCRDTGLDGGFSGTAKIGGSLVWNGRTIVTGYLYYDAGNTARVSHSVLGGPWVRVGDEPVAAVSGYMGVVPQEWRTALGGPALTGQCCLSIISRTSSGPALSTFNPDQVGRANPVPSTTLLYYPLEHALSGSISGRPLSNLSTTIGGVAFASGTRSVLFIGKIGIGDYCYGEASACGDPTSDSKGEHMYPYIHQVWAYDANDLVKVKNGQLQPWDVKPYATWRLTDMNNSGSASMRPGGATFDPATRRIYVTEGFGEQPRVHVYQLGAGQSAPPSQNEVCGDGVDNDGDGRADENCSSGGGEEGGGSSTPGACSVSSWSSWQASTPWSACEGGKQTRTEQRTRSVLNPPVNGGAACPALEQTRTATQACSASPTLPAPGPPTRIMRKVQGSTVSLRWLAPVVGGPPTSYIVEGGTERGQTTYSMPVKGTSVTIPNVGRGRYFVRVRGVNDSGRGAASDEVAVSVGCTQRPGKPRLTSTTNGNLVTFSWLDADGCSGSHYRIAVGAAPGASDLDLKSSDVTLAVASAPAGTYYARVQTIADSGRSEESNEVKVSVGSKACAPPSFETGLSAQAVGGGIGLWWDAVDRSTALSADQASPFMYSLEVGTAPGRNDLGTYALGRKTAFWSAVPAGTYYARIRPTDICGLGRKSNEVKIQVQ